MKLRYYMRGLGIGIVVTALIMGIGSSRRNTVNDNVDLQLTDEGAAGSQAVVLSDLKENQTPEAGQISGGDADISANNATPTPAQTPEKTSAPAADPSQTPDKTSSQNTDSQTVTFTIENGTGSEAVSRNLAEAGLIENALTFNKFLCDKGYSKSIKTGSFEIPMGADEEEIAGIITGRR